MEALEIELGKFALTKTVQIVGELLRKADENRADVTKRCGLSLEAVRVAVKGLQLEFAQIIAQAKHCRLERDDERLALKLRIHTYLRVYNVRNDIDVAMSNLGSIEKTIDETERSAFRWPWVQADRYAAVADFHRLLVELRRLYNDLDAEWLRHKEAGTGYGVIELNELERVLEAPGPQDRAEILPAQIFERAERTIEGHYVLLKQLTDRIAETTWRLERSFK